MNNIEPVWLGMTDYRQSLLAQQEAKDVVKEGEEGYLMGYQHPSVITLGVRGDLEKDVLTVDDSEESFDVVMVRRGGQATLHNPGQLVVYPVLPLKKWNLGVKDYVCALEKATKNYLKIYGIEGFSREGSPGVYTENGKIAFIGVQVSSGVSCHGVSINLMNSLEDFSHIRSCGEDVAYLDKVSNYGEIGSMEEEFHKWSQCFREQINLQSSMRSC